jgi:hypothetical protein
VEGAGGCGGGGCGVGLRGEGELVRWCGMDGYVWNVHRCISNSKTMCTYHRRAHRSRRNPPARTSTRIASFPRTRKRISRQRER